MPGFAEIVNEGKYFVIQSYSFKDELTNIMRESFLAAIHDVSGEKVAADVRTHGLAQLHRFIDPDDIINIQDKASRILKNSMLRLTGTFARDVLGMNDDFYLDIMTIARVKTPFEFARRSKLSYLDYSKQRGRKEFKRDPALTSGYHRDLPFPAWAHGPHSDTYFGHSFDGINLWWCVDGVTSETGMVFYPQIICDKNIPVLEEPPYLGPGMPMPMPVFFDLDPGDVIAFNSDTLHATRVNLSDVTRVSFSTRLNPGRPRFDQRNFRHVKLWMHSTELAKLETGASLPDNEMSHRLSDERISRPEEIAILEVPKEDPGNAQGRPGPTFQTNYQAARIVITVDAPYVSDQDIELPPSVCIADGEKALVQFSSGRQLVVARIEGKLFAFTAKCPHLGYDLIDGPHAGDTLICAGHGIAFNMKTGQSRCDSFRLGTFSVAEENGRIVLRGRKAQVPSGSSI